MARKKKKSKIAAARVSDEELIARLEDDAPEVLTATVSDETFGAAVEGLLKEKPLSDNVPHFFCRKCGEYHLKTHPHYARRGSEKV